MNMSSTKYLAKLRGHSVLLVGGSTGIGYGIAEACLEYGASVVIASRSQSKIDAAVSSLKISYPDSAADVRGHTVDLNAMGTNTEEQLIKLFNFVTENGAKPIDHVVDTSGDLSLIGKLNLETATPELMGQATSVRFMGVYLLCKVASRYLKKDFHSSITLTSGALAYKPSFPGFSAIAGASGGKESMTKALALELAPIRVNLVVPGAIETDLLWNSMVGQQKEKVKAMYEAKTLLKRIGQVEDVVEMYLASLRSAFLTATSLHCEGGFYLS